MDDSNQQVHNWGDVVQLSKMYYTKDDFIGMRKEFKAMWSGHHGQINVIKHWIELLEDTIKPIQSAPYRSAPKTREFENMEMKRMLSQ